MFNIQLVAGNKIQDTAYILQFLCVSQKKKTERMDQTNLLPPTNLKSYQCVNLSKANKSASKILFFAHSSLIFSKKKQYLVLSFSPRNTEGSQNPRSELSPGKWTSQTKAKSENVFFQDRNTTSKKKKVNGP